MACVASETELSNEQPYGGGMFTGNSNGMLYCNHRRSTSAARDFVESEHVLTILEMIGPSIRTHTSADMRQSRPDIAYTRIVEKADRMDS